MKVAGKILRSILVIAILALTLIPLYMWIHYSFPMEDPRLDAAPGIQPPLGFNDIEGIRAVIGLTFLYSIPTSILAAFIHTLLAFGLAYGLARGRFPLREEMRLICFLALFVPATVIIGPLYRLNAGLGIQGHFAALFFAMWALPWLSAILYLYLNRLPERMELYASADGMTTKQIFTNLILPYSYKGLIATFLIAFLASYHSLFAAAAAIPTDYFAAHSTNSFSYLPVMISYFKQPPAQLHLSAKLLIALIFQIPSIITLPFLLIYGIPMLRTILTGRFRVRMRSSIV